MNFHYKIEPDRKMVTVTPTGNPDFPSSIDAIRAVVSDPAFGPDFGVLCDFREIQYTPSIAELLNVGNFLAMPGILKGHRIALVVSSDSHFTLAGLLAKIANTWGTNIAVFRLVDQAKAWLEEDLRRKSMSHLIPGEYDVTLNGVRIHYTVRGSGPVMIAHSGGPGMDARGWDNFAGIEDFVTIVAIHPRGSGLSGPPAGDAYLLPDYASDLQALRLHLGVDKPMIMGWSHGGMVAMQFAVTYPNSLSKLILFDTSAYFGEFLGDIEGAVQEFKHESWFEKSFAALQAEWAGEYKTDEDMARLWAEEMKFYFKKFDGRAEAYHERTKDLPIRIAPLKAFNEKEAPILDLRPHLHKITVPTLVIVGRHDFITNVAMAEEIVKHIPNTRLEIFEESGHYAFVEEPEKFYRMIKEFVES